LSKRYQEQLKLTTTLDFPKLKHIHLHELPKLHDMCGHKVRMTAPELETVKIRGCWSLKRLPIISTVLLGTALTLIEREDDTRS
jgi:hypothetical protein